MDKSFSKMIDEILEMIKKTNESCRIYVKNISDYISIVTLMKK